MLGFNHFIVFLTISEKFTGTFVSLHRLCAFGRTGDFGRLLLFPVLSQDFGSAQIVMKTFPVFLTSRFIFKQANLISLSIKN
jgi:hypothetical protein